MVLTVELCSFCMEFVFLGMLGNVFLCSQFISSFWFWKSQHSVKVMSNVHQFNSIIIWNISHCAMMCITYSLSRAMVRPSLFFQTYSGFHYEDCTMFVIFCWRTEGHMQLSHKRKLLLLLLERCSSLYSPVQFPKNLELFRWEHNMWSCWLIFYCISHVLNFLGFL